MENQQSWLIESIIIEACGSASLFFLGVMWRLYEGDLLPDNVFYSGHDSLTRELVQNCLSLVDHDRVRKAADKPRLIHDFWPFVAVPVLRAYRKTGPMKNRCGRPKVSLSLRKPSGSDATITEVIGLDPTPKTVDPVFDLAPQSLNNLVALCEKPRLAPIDQECLIDLAFVLTDAVLRKTPGLEVSDNRKQIVGSPNRLFFLAFDRATAPTEDDRRDEAQAEVPDESSPKPQTQTLAAGAR